MASNLQCRMHASHGAKLRRDVLVALAIKLGLLACIYVLFFAPANRPSSDASATADALLGAATAGDAP